MNSKISKSLAKKMDAAAGDELIEIVIGVKGNPATSVAEEIAALAEPPSTDERKRAVAGIQSDIHLLQQEILNDLKRQSEREDIASYDAVIAPFTDGASIWVANAIEVRATRRAIKQLAERTDVTSVAPYFEEKEEERFSQEISSSKTIISSIRNMLGGDCEPNLRQIGAPRLWYSKTPRKGDGAVVAVIDSGAVDFSHPDLTNRKWLSTRYPAGGRSFQKTGYKIKTSHGTKTAGIIAGDGSHKIQTGVAPKACIMSLDVGNFQSNAWRAIQFALENGADVINMSKSWFSIGLDEISHWRHACEVEFVAGVAHVNSAGNRGNDYNATGSPFKTPQNIGSPGRCPPPWLSSDQHTKGGLSAVITCGAIGTKSVGIDHDSGRGPVSWEHSPYADYPWNPDQNNTGLSKPDICAPGRDRVASTRLFYDDEGKKLYYDWHRNTSAAAPHVSGALALLVGACKQSGARVCPSRLCEAISKGADKSPRTKYKHFTVGAGVLRVDRAYHYGKTRKWWC